MVENFSKEETSRLRTELSFELKTKVVGSFKVYNFHEEKFFKFKTDLLEKDQTYGLVTKNTVFRILGFYYNLKRKLSFKVCVMFWTQGYL